MLDPFRHFKRLLLLLAILLLKSLIFHKKVISAGNLWRNAAWFVCVCACVLACVFVCVCEPSHSFSISFPLVPLDGESRISGPSDYPYVRLTDLGEDLMTRPTTDG